MNSDIRWTFLPQGLAGQFIVLLSMVLLATNLIAAVLLAREGSEFDRLVRIQRDMGRLVALVSTLEEIDAESAAQILDRSDTGYTRFSIDPQPIGSPDAGLLHDVELEIEQALPGRDVRVVAGNPEALIDRRPSLMLISVRLTEGVHAGQWLNSLVYPLTGTMVLGWKSGFFVPLIVTLLAAMAVGLVFIRRMTRPLSQLVEATKAAGRGDRLIRVTEDGARELRAAAAAFNDMQQRIADFDASRQRLLADIGHDLRTPITGLRVRAEMLDDPADRLPMVRMLDDMAVMTEDLLRYAKEIWQGEAANSTDLAALLAALCEDRGAALVVDGPVQVNLRQVAMSRAIGNLIDNAQRYGGGARVQLSRLGRDAVIAVEDDGPGIPRELLGAVLEPFVRGEQSRNSGTGGTGLGLAIARAIVEGHGGRLKLTNRASGGLRAEVRLALAA